jgi:murein DD-endopeptidase MepM/ murein hydrolase activator NlpD
MMTAYVVLFKWLQASVSCLLAGFLVWALLALAQRYWPALASRRSVWLTAQAITTLAALLAFLPYTAYISVAPAVPLSTSELSTMSDMALDAPDAAVLATPPGTARDAVPPLLLPALWAIIYGAGLVFALARLLRVRRLWRAMLTGGQQLSPSALLAHGAFSRSQLEAIEHGGLTVIETDVAISPMLVGMRRPLLLLPRHLRSFSVQQQHMIVAHELQHWRSRDPLYLRLSGALRTIFWFNPALRWMGARLEWALEVVCDQHVLTGRPQLERKQYAAALLQQWRAQTTTLPAGGVAFSDMDGATATARIRQMQQDRLPALSRTAACTVVALLIAVLAGGAMLQPALAFNAGQLPSVLAGAAPAPQPIADEATAWRYPIDKMRVTGFFGIHRSALAAPHKGIDMAAPNGTPVHAAAAGVVVLAGALTEHGGRYGKTVIIEHGARRSLYAHLSSITVKVGERVAAGTPIGTVGETGFASGPHLHFEIREQDRLVDPATVLADLDVHASKRALRMRRTQQGS